MTPRDDWLNLRDDFRSCLQLPEANVDGVLRDVMARAGKLLWPMLEQGLLPDLNHFVTARREIWDNEPSDDAPIDHPNLKFVGLWILACWQMSRRIADAPPEPIPSTVGMPPRPGQPAKSKMPSPHQTARYYAQVCEWLVTRAAQKAKTSTAGGGAQPKLVAAFSAHHGYSNGSCTNWEPIGIQELYRKSGIGSSDTANRFIDKHFGNKQPDGKYSSGLKAYERACADKAKLITILKLINGEVDSFTRQLASGYDPTAERKEDDDA